MSEDEKSLLERRMEVLERESSIVRRVGYLSLAIIGLFLLLGVANGQPSGEDDVVTARRIELRDEQGNVRLSLGASPEEGKIEFRGSSGDMAMSLTSSYGIPSFTMYGAEERKLVNIMSLPEGSSFIRLSSGIDEGFFIASLDEVFGPTISLRNSSGEIVSRLDLSGLQVMNPNRKGRIRLTMEDGRPMLKLVDDNGFSSVLGSADLITPATGESSAKSAASLVLFDKDGKVIREFP